MSKTINKKSNQPSCKDFFSKVNTNQTIVGELENPSLPKPVIESVFFQADPFIGSNLFESNPKPIQPILSTYPTKNRRFVKTWFCTFTWLEYSISEDKAFCYSCRIFGKETSFAEPTFTSIGFNNWVHAIAAFKKHENSKCHKTSTELLA